MLATAGSGWLAPHRAQAQYYYLSFPNAGHNPGNLNTDDEFPIGNGDPNWVTIVAGTPITSSVPVWSRRQAMPWSFQLGGQAVDSFKVSTTGVLTFDTTRVVPPFTDEALPSALIPDKSVCVWGMRAGPGDYVAVKQFGTAPRRQLWVQFNSCTIPGVNLGYLYWSIVLEEGTNNIYMVDQRTNAATSLTVGVQLDTATAVQVAASPNVTSPVHTDPTPADNSYYQFLPRLQPAYDAAALTFRLPTYVGRTTGSVPLAGNLANFGTQTLTSYDLNYSVNGGAPVTQAITGVSIASLATAPFVAPLGWQPTANGRATLRMWASNLNGNPDALSANDTITRVTTVVDTIVGRTVVLESFTSSTCAACNPGDTTIRAVQRAHPGELVRISYQQNFPALTGNVFDPYYTSESGARFRYYDGFNIPYVLLDGGWRGNANALTSGIFTEFHDVPAVVSIEANYTIDTAGRTVTANARVIPYTGFNANAVAVHMVVTERQTRNNVRNNGETDFYNVMKKMLPDQDGTTLGALTTLRPVDLTETYTFPVANTVESFDSLEVVVFVQDLVTKQVLNGANAERGHLVALTPDEVALGALSIAPNPTAGEASVYLTLRTAQTVSADVMDALGRVVATVPAQSLPAGAQALLLPLTGVSPGLYVVRVTTNDSTRTRRLVMK